MEPLTGRIVVVTGGSKGIGRTVAERFAANGDLVVIAARDAGAVEDAAQQIKDRGGEALGWSFDVTDPEAVEAFFSWVVDTQGSPPHVCVFSAGLGHWAPVVETSDEQWTQTMRVNLDGVFYCTRAALRRMVGTGSGHLLYVASVLGTKGVPNMAAYAASKAAVSAFGESVAAEVKPHRMKVTVLYPGTTFTSMREHQVGRPQTPDITDEDLQLRPEDVAEAAFWVTTTSPSAFPTRVYLEPPGEPATH